MMIRESSVRDRLHDTYLVYIPNLDVYRENRRTIALATMNNEEYFAFPTTGLLDVELTVQLRWNSGQADANFCRKKMDGRSTLIRVINLIFRIARCKDIVKLEVP